MDHDTRSGEQDTNELHRPADPSQSAHDAVLVSFSSLLRESFNDARVRPKLIAAIVAAIVGITVVGAVGMIVLVSMAAPASTGAAVLFGLLGAVYFVLLMFAYIAAGVALMRVAAYRATPVGYWESVQWGIRHIWPIVVIGLFIQLTTATGYVLFLIPGIALAGYTAFSYFVFIKEGTRGMDALIRSIDLVYGKWWAVFFRMLVLSLAAVLSVVVPMALFGMFAQSAPVAGGVLIALFLVVAYPFAIVWIVFGMARIFESLEALKPIERFDPDSYRTLRATLIVAAIIGVPVLIGWNAFSIYSEVGSDPAEPQKFEDAPFEFNIDSV